MVQTPTDWIEWDPQHNPAAGQMVEYRLRNGEVDTEAADTLQWSHCGDEYDIVAYRVVDTTL